MGYEHKLIVADKIVDDRFATVVKGKKYFYADVIASIYMCKAPGLYELFEGTAADCFIYADDGNTEIIEDRYGDPLGMVCLDEAINVLKYEIQKGKCKDYLRWKPALGLLKGFKTDQWRNIVVLRYGY